MNENPTVEPRWPRKHPLRVGWHRWMICALLLFAAIINYVDRQVIGILKPTLTEAFGWTDERIYASIIFSFQLAYALGSLGAGRFMDAVGVRRGFALAVSLWSVAAAAHGLAGWVPHWQLPFLSLDVKTGFAVVMLTSGAAGLAVARFALGIGEGGRFPPRSRPLRNGFPKRSGRWPLASSTPGPTWAR